MTCAFIQEVSATERFLYEKEKFTPVGLVWGLLSGCCCYLGAEVFYPHSRQTSLLVLAEAPDRPCNLFLLQDGIFYLEGEGDDMDNLAGGGGSIDTGTPSL